MIDEEEKVEENKGNRKESEDDAAAEF